MKSEPTVAPSSVATGRDGWGGSSRAVGPGGAGGGAWGGDAGGALWGAGATWVGRSGVVATGGFSARSMMSIHADICPDLPLWLVATICTAALPACVGAPSICAASRAEIVESHSFGQPVRRQPKPFPAGVGEGRQLGVIRSADSRGGQIDHRLRRARRQAVDQFIRFRDVQRWRVGRLRWSFRVRRGLNFRGLRGRLRRRTWALPSMPPA